jgi:hypothetical protein
MVGEWRAFLEINWENWEKNVGESEGREEEKEVKTRGE